MQNNSKERGSLLLEAAMVLPFILAIFSLLVYFINMFIIESYIQYGLNQAANEIGGYTYYLEYLGLNDQLRSLHSSNKENGEKIDSEVKKFTTAADDIKKASEDVSGTYGKLQSLWGEAQCETSNMTSIENLTIDDLYKLAGIAQEASDSVNQSAESAKKAASSTKEAFEALKRYAKDPMYVINLIIGQAKSELTDVVHQLVGNVLGKILIEKYVNDGYLIAAGVVSTEYNGTLSGDQYNSGVCGLDFRGSTFLADDDCRVVDLVVSYRIKFPVNLAKFANEGTIIHDNSILIVQRAACYGWVNGDNSSPKDNKDEYNKDEAFEASQGGSDK